MKRALVAVGVAGLLSASGFVAWSVFSGPRATDITPDVAKSFDLSESALPARPAAPAFAPTEEVLRDSVAAHASPRPIVLDAMSRPGVAPAVSAAAAAPARTRSSWLTPRLEKAARASRAFVGLLGSPARAIASGSVLRSPRDLRRFLSDRRAVEGYLDSGLVRAVLASPTLAKALIGNPAVVRAVLGSAAMQDPATVRLLLGSRMMAKILDCRGVQEALGDPAVVRRVADDPETGRWIAANPSAVTALASAAPALANALAR